MRVYLNVAISPWSLANISCSSQPQQCSIDHPR